MSDFITRLKQERDELDLKRGNLNTFMFSEEFEDIDQIQKGLLQIQYYAMITYLKCLNERLVWLIAKQNVESQNK
jgi:hypothetical protein